MANDKRFVAKNGLDNNNLTITNVASPVNPSDVSTMQFSSNASNLTAGIIPVARLSGSYDINISGNSATSSVLQTARTISLTGDVTGSVSFNGSSNVSIATTVAANSVALGTDTTGNYAASVAVSGNGLTITGAAGEGTAFTVNSSATAANTASTLVFRDSSGNFSAGTITANLNGNATSANTATTANSATTATTATNVSGGTASVTTLTASGAANLNGGTSTTTLSTTGDVTVGGNLIVNGTTITINSSVTTLDDPIITLGGDVAPTADDNKDRGVEFRWHDGTAARTGFFGFDDSTGFFTFIPNGTNTSEVYSGALGVIDAVRITGSAASWTTPRNLTLSGDATATFSSVNGTANVNATLTLSTVNSNVGTFGSASSIPVVTVNAKGLVTAVTTAAIQTGTNITDTNVNGTNYLTFTTATSGSVNALNVDATTTPLTYNPSTNIIGASISGNAATATTANNANSVNGYNVQEGQSQNWGTALLKIATDGVVECGRYIDFHGASNDTVDSTVRLDGGGPGSSTLSLSGNFTATGNVTAFSDARLKKDLEVIPNALEKVQRLTGYTYTRIDSGERQTGLIAQDLQKVLPEAVIVNTDEQQTLSVAYGNLVGLLVEAIKELEARIKVLEGGI